MNLRKVIEKSFRREGRGTNVAGGVDAVVSANVGEPGSRSHLSSRSRRRIVQKGGRTIVDEHEHETRESGNR